MPTPATLQEIRRATRHHGVAHASAFNLTQRQLDLACESGVLVRRHKSVFVDPAHPRTRVQELAVGVVAAGRVGGGWARSAAAQWDLRDEHPSVPEIVVPYGRTRRIEGVSVHRSRTLVPSMLTIRDHIRVTNPLITVLDLGAVVGPIEVADVIIRGRQKKYFSVADVRRTIDLHARPGRTGIGVARRAVALVMIGDRPAESVLEFRFHIGPGRLGLPPYSYQHKVTVGRRTFFIDFAYPEVMLAIEVDGYEKRKSRESLAYDNERANALVLAGWTILRFGWDAVQNDPASVAAAILLKLAQLEYAARRL